MESALEALKADFRWFVSVRLQTIDGVHLNQDEPRSSPVSFASGLSSRCLTTDSGGVFSRVQNNAMEQVMKAALPACAIQAIAGAISSHTSMATRLLSNESTRDVFLTVVYELLKKNAGADLLGAIRTSY